MLYKKFCPLVVFVFLCLLSMVSGCGSTKVDSGRSEQTDLRTLEERPASTYLGVPTVNDFLAACDMLARDLVMSAVVQTAMKPIVMEIRPIENKTGEELDLTIYPQTIRGMINKQGVRNVVFRDEKAREQIIGERIGQSNDPIYVQTHSEIKTSKHTRPSSLNSKYGVGTLPPTSSAGTESARTMDQSTEISGKVADVDYFLNGFIYAINEMSVGSTDRGYRYFQFQFRLTDAQNGLVIWENMYQVKRDGVVTIAPR